MSRSKFTAENREKIYQALRIGASRRTAAHAAGVDEAQVRRWFKQGSESEEGTRYREFYETVLSAEAAPRVRALGLIYRDLPDNPNLAWKFIERREPGYEPPLPNAPAAVGPTLIHLQFSDGSPATPPWLRNVIDAEVVADAEESPALSDGGDPAAAAP